MAQRSSRPSTHVADSVPSILSRTAASLEYASLRHIGHCPLGMYIIPSAKNILVWDAVFFVHQGYYTDSIVKFRLTFPGNYPESPPSVTFLTDMFHPLISSTGTFNLTPRFRPWRPKEHHTFDILHWIKAAFKKHVLDRLAEDDCFNKEAYRYRDSTQSFAALASQCASLSRSDSMLFDLNHLPPMGNAPSEIVFSKLNATDMQQQRTKLGLSRWEE